MIFSHTNLVCPQCKNNYLKVMLKNSQVNSFLYCIGFPRCNYRKYINESDICPKCYQGKLVGRRGKWGIDFVGCSRYPQCDYLLSARKKGTCPKCGTKLCFRRRDGNTIFIACSNRFCNYTRSMLSKDIEKNLVEEDINNNEIQNHDDDLSDMASIGDLIWKDGDDYVGFRD